MTLTMTSPIARSLDAVRRDIDDAALRCGRDPSQIQLIAVSKAFGVPAITAALEAGQLDFGENRVQELAAKHEALGAGPRWHFVGRLQRNKVRRVLATGAVIHSVDRMELALEISRRATRPVQILVEVNISGEESKGGVEPVEANRLVGAVLQMPNLELVGLMGMARKTGDPELARPAFRQLARLRDEVAAAYSSPRIHHLSMGMSQDYRVAVEEGATMVRVGEAIFGPRTSPHPGTGSQQRELQG
ncbi:MAG TPA: YggS family pyridoxal phosphate-dependent enzyme [Actinomycetota bacterium]|nr:YggS family pyridoxal phosphate-dependent enzyme [Actinomycetota bacterium]